MTPHCTTRYGGWNVGGGPPRPNAEKSVWAAGWLGKGAAGGWVGIWAAVWTASWAARGGVFKRRLVLRGGCSWLRAEEEAWWGRLRRRDARGWGT